MAVDLDLRREAATRHYPFTLLDVNTGAAKRVSVPNGFLITLEHTGMKADGSDSTAGDYVVMMHGADAMSADKTAGDKQILFAGGGAIQIFGDDLKTDTIAADGKVLQLQAVTNTGKIAISFVPVPARKG